MNGKECDIVNACRDCGENTGKVICERTVKCCVLGREICIHITDTGSGINVLLEGGDRSHIGAVAVAAPDLELQVLAFPGHREDVICRQWAGEIARKYNGPVVVEAGIHYDHIKKNEIKELLAVLEEELQVIFSLLEKCPKNR